MTTLHKSRATAILMLSFLLIATFIGAADPMRWDLAAYESDVISAVLCTLTEDDGFGSMNEDTTETVFRLYYELEISSTSVKTDEEIAGGIESMMLSDIVLPTVFPNACSSPATEGNEGRKRLLLRGTTNNQRRLNVASGVSTEPVDIIIPGAPCTTSSPDNSCIVVESGFTLYSIPAEEGEDPLASNSVMEKIEQTTRNAIKSALESGYFNNDDIVGVNMKSEEFVKEENLEAVPPFSLNVNTKGTGNEDGNDTLLFSIAAVAAALVIVFGSAFYIKKKKNAREQQGQRALASKDVGNDLPYEEGSELVTKEISNKTPKTKKEEEETEIGKVTETEKATVVFEAASSTSSNNNKNDSSEEETSVKSGSVGSLSRASVVKRLGGGVILSTDDNKDSVSVVSSTSRASIVKRIGGGQVDNKDAVSVSNASVSMKRLGGGQVVIEEEDEEEESDDASTNADNRSKASNSIVSETASIIRRLGGGLMGQVLGSTTTGGVSTTGNVTTPMPKHDEEA